VHLWLLFLLLHNNHPVLLGCAENGTVRMYHCQPWL